MEHDRKNHKSGWAVVSWDVVRSPPDWLAAMVYILTAIFCFALISLVIIPTLWKLGTLVAFGNPNGEDLRAALLGVGGIVAAPFVIWRIWTSHVSSVAALKQANIANQSLAHATFSKSIEQLGLLREVTTKDSKVSEPNYEARIGAMFSLTELARTQSQFLLPTIETLAAYLRFHSPKRQPLPSDLVLDVPSSLALRMKADQIAKPNFRQWSESEPKIRYDAFLAIKSLLNLLSHSAVEDNVDLSGICLRKVEFNPAHFKLLILDNSQLDEMRADSSIFERCQVQFVSARSISLMFSKFHKSFLKHVVFTHAGLDIAEFQQCRIILGDFRHASLASTKFQSSLLVGCKFQGAYVRGVSFAGSEITDTDFSDINFEDVSFQFTKLRTIRFHRSQHSTFLGIGERAIEIAVLKNIIWEGAWLEDVDLSQVENLTQFDIDQTYYGDSEVLLPHGMQRPNHWADSATSEADLEILSIQWRKNCALRAGLPAYSFREIPDQITL